MFRRVFQLLVFWVAAFALLLSAPARAGQHPLGRAAQPAAPALSAFEFGENRIKGEKAEVANYTYRAPLAAPRLHLGKAPALSTHAVGPREREDYGFTGKEADVEVGLTYFGKRYLVPQAGRWLSPDPLALHVPGKADLNLYAYVRGRVFTSVDPFGLMQEEEVAGRGEGVKLQVPAPSPVEVVKHAWNGVVANAVSFGTMMLQGASLMTAPVGMDSSVKITTHQNIEQAGQDAQAKGTVATGPDPENINKLYGKGVEIFATIALSEGGAAVTRKVEQKLVRTAVTESGVAAGTVAPKGTPGAAAQDAARHEALLNQARAARDAKAAELGKLQPPARPAAVTAGYHTETGEIAVGCSKGGGNCAENQVVKALGGDASKVKMTEAVVPRKHEAPYKQKPICEKCEQTYGREAFPKDTTEFKSDKAGN